MKSFLILLAFFTVLAYADSSPEEQEVGLEESAEISSLESDSPEIFKSESQELDQDWTNELDELDEENHNQ